MSIELKVGEWYETREGGRIKIVVDAAEHKNPIDSFRFWGLNHEGHIDSYGQGGSFAIPERIHPQDIIKHLPGCTGWDWVEPKPEKWRDAKPSDFAEGVPVPCRVRDFDSREWIRVPVLGYIAETEYRFVTWCDDYASGGSCEVTAYRYCQVLDTEDK